MATTRHHRIDYIELSVTDLTVARAFYAGAFGWTFVDYGPTYAGIVGADGAEVGGLAVVETPAPAGGPLVLLYSDDLDASAEAVEAAGGSVVSGPYDFPGGRRFHFTDPSGTVLGVWASS